VTHPRAGFLRVNAPLAPFGADDNLYHMSTCYRRRAPLALPRTGQQGMQALRHTVATHLVATGPPLETSAALLGHRSLASTQL
jgi:integrase